jgi:hypothetical protein
MFLFETDFAIVNGLYNAGLWLVLILLIKSFTDKSR